MNKRELVEHVSQSLETTKSAAEETVQVVLEAVRHGLRRDGEVSVAGFGTWTRRERAARVGRNPQTGEPMDIPASTSVGFKPAKAWKDELN